MEAKSPSTVPPPVSLAEMLCPILDQVGEVLTPSLAEKILEIRGSNELQSRVDYLAELANNGELGPAERFEYDEYIQASQVMSILKLKARKLLEPASGGV